jgi:hypothetical protein
VDVQAHFRDCLNRIVRLRAPGIALALIPIGAAGTEGISIERGKLLSIMAGCHDCHTEGYSQTEGLIDPEKDFKGSSSPWGTTYPSNLRIVVAKVSEDYFVDFMKTLKTDPPMPWYNVRAWPEDDIRSFYRYVRSLGAPGRPAPEFVADSDEPRTPYVVLSPPQKPKPCSRDLDWSVGPGSRRINGLR